MTSAAIRTLRVEHVAEALGIGEARPRLSWTVTADDAWRQDAYQVQVDRGGETLSSEWIQSRDSVLVPWPFAPLTSREACVVRVRVRSASASPWSAGLPVEAGLLEMADWAALGVGPSWPEDRDSERRPPLLRRDFWVDAAISKARLYVTALGLYEVELNGRRVGAEALAPGWTSYHHRLRYHTYDVTQQLVEGDNTVGAWLADGWYRGRLGFHGGYSNLYGDRLALLAQLEVTYLDGTRAVVAATDASWRAALSPIHATGLLDGERYDARDELDGWSSPGYDATGWSAVDIVDVDLATLVAPTGPPVRCTEVIAPLRIDERPDGRLIIDFGQNLVGRLALDLRGQAGGVVTVRHAEVLQHGELFVEPLRGARSTDAYTLRGGGLEHWEPRFTLHGFRFAEVTGWAGGDPYTCIAARVYHTDMVRTGWFTCSDERVNSFHANVVWSMRGNFVDLPTDCPQRDERLGWTGDLQIFAPVASFLYDCRGLLSSWLTDVAAEQLDDGTVPWFVPSIPGGPEWSPARPGAAWGDVVTLTPWVLHMAWDDVGLLQRQYMAGKAWVELVERLAGPDHLWNTGFQLGDWLDPAAPPNDPAAGRTDRYLIATAYFAESARTLALTAETLGLEEEACRFAALHGQVRDAFRAEWVLAGGLLTSDAQTAYAVSLAFGLLEPHECARAADRLAGLVEEADFTIQTGFVGTPLVTRALSDNGHLDTAYRLLLQDACPSWLYPVTMGATTVWERWDSMLPDGTVHPGGMNSFNHYALGAVADWLHRTVAGLAPAEPGYRTISVRPRPGGGLTHASARHLTPYGLAEVTWRRTGERLTVGVTVPVGSRAVVELPGGEPAVTIGPGTHTFESACRSADDERSFAPH